MARSTRAYALMVNFSGSDYLGSNELFTLNPVDLCDPVTFAIDSETFLQWPDTPGFDLPIWRQSRQGL